MDEVPCPYRDKLEDALANLNWSKQYHDRAVAQVAQIARSLDRQAHVKRNVQNHRAKVRAQGGRKPAA